MGDSSPGLVQVSAVDASQTVSPVIVYRNRSVTGYTRSLTIFGNGSIIALGINDIDDHIDEGSAFAEPTEVTAFAERLFNVIEGLPGYLRGGSVWNDRVDIEVRYNGQRTETGCPSDPPREQTHTQMVLIEKALDSIWDMVPKATIE